MGEDIPTPEVTPLTHHVVVVCADRPPSCVSFRSKSEAVDHIRRTYAQTRSGEIRDTHLYIFEGSRARLTGGPTRTLIFADGTVQPLSDPVADVEDTDLLLAPVDVVVLPP